MTNAFRRKTSTNLEKAAAKTPPAENASAARAKPNALPDWPPTEEALAHEPLSRKELYQQTRTILRLLDYNFWRAYAAGFERPTRQITPTLVQAELTTLDKKLRRYRRDD
jgi:hypothetical protein